MQLFAPCPGARIGYLRSIKLWLTSPLWISERISSKKNKNGVLSFFHILDEKILTCSDAIMSDHVWSINIQIALSCWTYWGQHYVVCPSHSAVFPSTVAVLAWPPVPLDPLVLASKVDLAWLVSTLVCQASKTNRNRRSCPSPPSRTHRSHVRHVRHVRSGASGEASPFRILQTSFQVFAPGHLWRDAATHLVDRTRTRPVGLDLAVQNIQLS